MAVPWNFTLNVNLQEGAVQQLEFVQEVFSQPALEDDKVLKHSIFRYENYWLPLAGKHPNETLAAPLDVEWVWLCHMLSPIHYQKDCNSLVGRVVSHKLYSAMQRRKQQQKARSLWQAEYPREPFHVELNSDLFYTDDDLPSRLSYDIMAAATRQRTFYYQVSLPHYRDAQFLATSELRYKRFLYLQQQHSDTQLLPAYDIDLMWHTHMLHPLAYKIDTETVLGYTLPYHPLLDGPDPELHVLQAFSDTREAWRRTFDVNFEVCGASYRGEPSAGTLHALTPQQNFMASTKTATFIIEKVDVLGLPALKGKLVFKLYTGHNGKIGKCAATFKGEPPWQGKAVPDTDFETDVVNYLKIRVIDQVGMLACFGSREIVGEKDIDLRPTLDSLTHETSVEHSVSLSQVYGATVAQVTTHFCWPQRGPVHLYLRVGIFTHCPVPDHPETVFCHVPLRNIPKGIDNASYLAASHSFVNHSESVVLTCRVLHSVDLMQSALYVFYQDKMAAVAHLVGLDQLPLPTQISDARKVPYLNPRAGERGVLIKNHGGDWAVVIGRWTAVRKGGSRMGSRRGKDGLPGQLMIRVREMADFGWRELQLTYNEQHWRFTLGDLYADLKDGTIRIDNPDSQHIAEKVALTFSVALLHVLCMPRPTGWKRGTSLRPRTSRRGTRSSKWIPSDEMPFILAAGVLQETPTNSYIRQTHGVTGWTWDREGLLGPNNTDLMACRPEDGLGGMWASVTPGLHELCVQGPHVVPDANSGCSTQYLADGNSSISAQIIPDGTSSCSQIVIDTTACVTSEVKEEGGEVKAGLSTLVVPGGRPPAVSVTGTSGTTALALPADVPPGEVRSESPTPSLSEGKTALERRSSSEAKTGPGKDARGAATAAAACSKVVPSDKSLGISALAMLGGHLSSVHGSQRRAPPSPGLDQPAVHVTPADPTHPFTLPPDVVVQMDPAEEGDDDDDDGVVDTSSSSPLDPELQVEEEEEGEEEEESGGEGSNETREDHTPTPTSTATTSSSSSFQTGGELPLTPLLGVPEGLADFPSGSLSPRDMIDICEERIYSDYKCSLETGGVDDLIISDARFDDADEEIIVAVQSRRNSRRKDAPARLAEGKEAGGKAGGEEFAASLSAALSASLSIGDSDKDRNDSRDKDNTTLPVVNGSQSRDSPHPGTCSSRDSAGGACGGAS